MFGLKPKDFTTHPLYMNFDLLLKCQNCEHIYTQFLKAESVVHYIENYSLNTKAELLSIITKHSYHYYTNMHECKNGDLGVSLICGLREQSNIQMTISTGSEKYLEPQPPTFITK